MEKYCAKPASKRVNYINSGFLSPFYCPFSSLIDNKENKFFILRNVRFLLKLKAYFFNSNNQNKLNKEKFLAELKSTVENNFDEILSNSYTNVRLTAFERGTVAPYSQIYSLNNENNQKMAEKNIDFNLLKQTLNSVKKKMKLENEKELFEIESEEFFRLNLEELNQNEKLIGFVINSKFSLVNGLNAANAAIKTSYIIDTILNEEKEKGLKNTVFYRTPTSVKYNLAKINHFYN